MKLFKPYPTDAFTASIEDANKLKLRVTATKCPACAQLSLTLQKYTAGAKGYDAEVICGNCNMSGVINSTGYEYKGLNRKAKPR